MPHQVFILSPANCSGKRAGILMRPQAEFDLAVRLRTTGAPIAEIFSFMSGLYFRGKVAYARAFASPPAAVTGVHVIVPGLGDGITVQNVPSQCSTSVSHFDFAAR